MRRSCRAGFGVLVMAPLFLAAPALGSIPQQIGLNALIKRLGSGNQPTGAGIAVGQAEADEIPGGPLNVYPIPGGDLVNENFIPMSGALATSGHARDVGIYMYGVNGSAPGIDTVYTYEAGSWLQSGHLRANLSGNTTPPDFPPAGVRIFNNSWVANHPNDVFDNDALRRADFLTNRDQVLVVSGVHNGDPQLPLMAYMYNGISVGRSAGGHTSGSTPATHDGGGRMKPEIVAPGDATSYATGVMSAAVALMFETAQSLSSIAGESNADRTETIKAVLLAGANHRTGWSNGPIDSGPQRGVTSTPLDPIWGVDVVNVDSSHLILTGLEQEGAASPPSAPNITARGWDLTGVGVGASEWYRFRVNGLADKVSILATWHRIVPNTFDLGNDIADFNLYLYRVNRTGLLPLVGNAGLPHFASGNVVSQSAVDNIEHLFVRNLQPGQYVIELRRMDGLGGVRDVALAWLMPNIPRPADLNGDGNVNVTDLLALISAWGACSGCPADLNNDGFVNVTDLLMLISDWGP